MHGVGVADEEEAAGIVTGDRLVLAPDVEAAGQEFAGAGFKTERFHLRFQEGGKAGFVAGDAVNRQGAAKQVDVGVPVLRGQQLFMQV